MSKATKRSKTKVRKPVVADRSKAPVSEDDGTSNRAGEEMPTWQTTQQRRPEAGMTFERHCSVEGVHPYDEIAWELRDAVISGADGMPVFEQRGVEFPQSWSQTATAVVSSKYFRGPLGSNKRERSVRQLIDRVAIGISNWGRQAGYFRTESDAAAFESELTWLLVNQHLAFNSPVWFNLGVEDEPQCSACFINSVDDTMDSILKLAHTEGMLFKGGSGTGSNLSSIRSSKEQLAGGGDASGPVSFMRGFDAFAGVIKSGGKTRRAAKMVILDVDHPDVVEFVRCKESEERKAWALIDAGYDGSFNGEAYSSVFFQNSNNSVRVSDEFMQAVVDDKPWQTLARTDGSVVETMPAREVMGAISEAAWVCGDPGMQFDTTINDWHTCPSTDRIRASNPCSEYMFLDDSACNLASLNLMKFQRDDGEFDVGKFKSAVEIAITAQEIIVDFASYPTPLIGANSHRFRPLGLGYANLGAVLMSRGLPYDSKEGRDYAASITALMHGEAYLQSARIAAEIGPFPGYAENAEPMLAVMKKHRSAIANIDSANVPLELLGAATKTWDECLDQGAKHGFRNSQVTVLAPTGTIAFMMDCDTTGIEPDIALVKYKKLVGGGMLKIVNRSVPAALKRLGYRDDEIASISEHIDTHDTIEGAEALKPNHLSVFDCAFVPQNGQRSIHYLGHLRMMAAVQPFLSGAISKTVNLPREATADDIQATYMEAWKLGVKAVAIYRDGCKRTQPLNTKREDDEATPSAPRPVEKIVERVVEKVVYQPQRRHLPDTRQAVTHKFSIGGHDGYITVGLYENGMPGELFLVMAKEGSTISGLLDSLATSTSLALQYGVPLSVLVDKFTHTRYEPSGFTNNADIRIAKSITDYVFRWLSLRFLDTGEQSVAATEQSRATGQLDIRAIEAAAPSRIAPSESDAAMTFKPDLDAPPCHQCGSLMIRNGACHKCVNCGSTSGCS